VNFVGSAAYIHVVAKRVSDVGLAVAPAHAGEMG